MATTSVAVVIYDSRLFYPGGTVSRWANSLERNFTRYAIEEAPARSGELRAGIRGDVDHYAPKQYNITIQSTAPHSMYVLQGTTGPIFSRRMWGFMGKFPWLKYPRGGGRISQFYGPPNLEFLHSKGYALRVRAGNGYPERLALSVSGQKANPFFERAAIRTAARHSSLLGWRPTVAFWDAP